MNDFLTKLSEALPQLSIIAAVSGFAGWFLRGLFIPTTSSKPEKPAANDYRQDRVKNLESVLEKTKATNKTLKSELDVLRSESVSKATFENASSELEAARKTFEAESKRISSLETDLKKSQETIRNLNARANEADKTQKDRSFALENELSKARGQLAILLDRPDDTAALTAEIERLRESVAVSSRFAGEVRKREAVANAEIEKLREQLAGSSDRPAATRKIGPVVDSSRIAAAKAEVIRLVELNRQRNAEARPEQMVTQSDAISPLEESTPEAKKSSVTAELFSLD